MLTPEEAKKKREFEEACTQIIDQFPRLWRQLYLNCVQEGFTESQALFLVQAFIQKPTT